MWPMMQAGRPAVGPCIAHGGQAGPSMANMSRPSGPAGPHHLPAGTCMARPDVARLRSVACAPLPLAPSRPAMLGGSPDPPENAAAMEANSRRKDLCASRGGKPGGRV